MEDKNVKAVERIQEEIKKITEGKKRVLFFVLDTKGVPSGSLEYIYKLAKIANDGGYEVGMLYQLAKDEEFVGVGEWLGKEYADLPHYNTSLNEFEIGPSDVLFIPEIFTNVMNQTKKLPCKRIVLLQNFDYIVEQMPFAAQLGDFGIIDCITNTEYNAEYIKDVFPYVRTKVITPYIDPMFEDSIAPKKLVVNVIAKDQSDVNKIIKPFYWKYPTFKWVSFRDLRGFPKSSFADLLRDGAITIWADDTTSFGYSALEAMKSGSIVIAKVPNNPLKWMDSAEEPTLMSNCCLWFDNYQALHKQIASVVRAWMTDKVPSEIYTEAKAVTEQYTKENTEKEFKDYLEKVFDDRVKEMEILIKNIEHKLENKNEEA